MILRTHTDVREIATPLLGTGAGNLEYVKVFAILEEQFMAHSRADCLLDIFVTDETVYNELIKYQQSTANIKNSIVEKYGALHESDRKSEFLNRLVQYPCYLVGSSWGGKNDQSKRFFNEGIWEHDRDKVAKLVNEIAQGSVLFLKSTFANGSKSYLRIKGAGIVTENPKNGTLLKVDWKVKNIQYDIGDRGSYRSTVAKVNDKAIKEILGALSDWEIFKNGLFGKEVSPDNNLNQDDEITENADVKSVENQKTVESTLRY